MSTIRLDSPTQHHWLPFVYLFLLAGMIIVCAWAETSRQRKFDYRPTDADCPSAPMPGRVSTYATAVTL